MKMTVGLSLSYVCGCAECAREVENTVAAAIRDRTVTGVKLGVVPRCDHESADQLSARMKAPITQSALPNMVESAPDAGLGGSRVSTPPPLSQDTQGGQSAEGGGGTLPLDTSPGGPLNGFDAGGGL